MSVLSTAPNPRLRIIGMGIKGFPEVQGGIQKHCEELYPRLVEEGMDVTALIFARNRKHRLWKDVRLVGVPTLRLKGAEKVLYSLFATLYCLFSRVDLVLVHGIGSSFFASLLRLRRIPFILFYVSQDYQYGNWGDLGRYLFRLGERNGLRADRVVCVSQGYVQYLRTRFGYERAEYIPLGTRFVPRSPPTEEEVRILAARLGVAPGRFVLSIGRLVPEKGFDLLIEAFARLVECSQNAGCKLVIVGSADQPSDYARQVRAAAEAHPDIVLAGNVPRVLLDLLYRTCALYVLGSRHEGLPNVLLEALGFGCRIVASDIDAAKEVGLADWQYFRAGDAASLAARMAEHLSGGVPDPDYSALESRFDWDEIAAATARAIRKVADARCTAEKGRRSPS